MQIASLTPYVRPMLELFAVASLCGWVACFALGLSLFSPQRAILVGSCGVVIGWVAWRFLGLPFGPWISEVPIVPSIAGTFVAAFLSEVIRERREVAMESRGPEPMRQALSGQAPPASPPLQASSPADEPTPARTQSLEAR